MKTKFYSIVAFIITFGSYPQTGIRVYSSHDGGFENHATGNVQGGFTSAISLSTTTWSASTTSSTAIIRT
ncbi:MAG: hypothetical protein EXR20_06950, partial [Bacteroidetes bacterium]|nr:hypothetical protein [Bacteroidota bacterium]